MIEIRNLKKIFGETAVVDDVSFEVAAGETFALLGPNGSGKSTTLKCLVGLTVPTSGTVMVGGKDTWRFPREARELLSYLPQRVSFPDSLTPREIMEFYGELRRLVPGRIDQLLTKSDFDFDGFMDKRVGQLSGGMLQRLGLAVACLPDAPVLVLDEPTVGLDPARAVQFRQFVAGLKRQGKTILFASHLLTDVEQLADRVGFMEGGRLVANESISELRARLTDMGSAHVIGLEDVLMRLLTNGH